MSPEDYFKQVPPQAASADDPLVCDPEQLASVSNASARGRRDYRIPLAGTQKEIADKEAALNDEQQYHPMELPYLFALAIVLIAGLPWTWYFLLGRIRELSNAIRGQ